MPMLLHFPIHLCCISPGAREQAKIHVSPQAISSSVRSCLQTFCQETLAQLRTEEAQLSPLWPLCSGELWRKEYLYVAYMRAVYERSKG